MVNRLQGVDVVRVAAIIAVISLHTSPFSSPFAPVGQNLDLATVINQVARFAVPFFFVLSGYFWGRKIAAGDSVMSATLPAMKRTAFLLLFWSIVYLFPTDLFAAFKHGASGPIKGIYWNIETAIGRPFQTLLQGTTSHLWFLPALICSLTISALLLHYGQKALLVFLAIALFVIGLAGGPYRHTLFGFEANFNFRNGPFFSLALFVSGYLLAHRTASKAWLPLGLATAILGAGLQFFEVIMLHAAWDLPMTQDYVFGTYFFGLGMSVLAISDPKILQHSWAAGTGRLVLGIYASHMIFVGLLSPIDREFHGNWIWSILYVGVVFVLSFMLASFFARFDATKKLVT